METGRASAVAYPIQGLIKYHGLVDFEKRLPYHASISVCTAPTHSRTTVAVEAQGGDRVRIDGKPADPRALRRCQDVVDAVRRLAGDTRPFRMESVNSFPARIGLGSSASGFAALTLAAASAYGLALSSAQLSAIARLGAGSASRAVTGWFSEWVPAVGKDASTSVSHVLPGGRDIDMRTLVPVVMSDEPTEGAHKEVLSSPFFAARVAYVEGALTRMRDAVARRDVAAIGALAEADTLNLHAVTMTADAHRITWRPPTLAAMLAVRRLREEGVPCWFSIDTGATPYVNTTARHETAVAKALGEIAGVADLLHLTVGPAAHVVEDHLF